MPRLNLREKFAKAQALKIKKDELLVFKGLYSFFNFNLEEVYLILSRRVDWIDYYSDYYTWKVAWTNRPLSFWNKEKVKDEINNWMSLLKEEVFKCMNNHNDFNKVLKRYEKWIEEEREVLGWDG